MTNTTRIEANPQQTRHDAREMFCELLSLSLNGHEPTYVFLEALQKHLVRWAEVTGERAEKLKPAHDAEQARLNRKRFCVASDDGTAVHYTRSDDGDTGDSGTLFKVFPATATEEDIAEVFHMEGYNSGPGRPFADRPSIRRTKTRTLVTQTVGMDV